MTTPDQQNATDEIRRELQHNGYKVLPLVNMPTTPIDFREAIQQNLVHVDAVVQIMGSQYGNNLLGIKYSLIDYQNQIIREFMASRQKKGFRRYIWIPQDLKINDQRQHLYLQRIKHDDAGHNTEIIECQLESLKTILAQRLESNNHVRKIKYFAIKDVYLLTGEGPSPEADQLYSALSSSGLKVHILDYDEQIGIYTRHLQALRDNDSVILLHQNENVFWLNSKLRDIIKSQGIGRSEPFKRVVIISKQEPDKQLVSFIKSKVELFITEKIDVDTVLHKLITE